MTFTAEESAVVETAVRKNPVAWTILNEAHRLRLPSWYLVAGAITHSVWNHLHGFEPTNAIKDYDLAYFDDSDLSAESERKVEAETRKLFAGLGADMDVKNQARVHLWFPDRFGRTIEPYTSTEHAISCFPTTASCIGVRVDHGDFAICAPLGLSDLLAMVVRANPVVVDETVYLAKTDRWRQVWPRLTVLSWPS